MQEEHIQSFLPRTLHWNGTFFNLKRNPKTHTCNRSRPQRKTFFRIHRRAQQHQPAGRETASQAQRWCQCADGVPAAPSTSDLEQESRVTGKETSHDKVTAEFTESCSSSAPQACNLGTVSCSLPGSPASSCWKALSDALQAAHYRTGQDVDRTAGWDVVSGVDLSTDVW